MAVIVGVIVIWFTMATLPDVTGFPDTGSSLNGKGSAFEADTKDYLSGDQTSALPSTEEDGHKRHSMRHHGHDSHRQRKDVGNHGDTTETSSHSETSPDDSPQAPLSLNVSDYVTNQSHVHSNGSQGSHTNKTRIYLKILFDKYGHDGKMTVEGLEHLLQNIGFRDLHKLDHDLSSHKQNGSFVNLHGSHDHIHVEHGHTQGHDDRSQGSNCIVHEHDHSKVEHEDHDHDHNHNHDHGHSDFSKDYHASDISRNNSAQDVNKHSLESSKDPDTDQYDGEASHNRSQVAQTEEKESEKSSQSSSILPSPNIPLKVNATDGDDRSRRSYSEDEERISQEVLTYAIT